MFCVLSYFTGAVFFTVNNALFVTCSLRLIGLVSLYCFCMSHIIVLCSLFECSAPEHSCVFCDSDGPTTATAAVIFAHKYSLKNCSLTFFFSFCRSFVICVMTPCSLMNGYKRFGVPSVSILCRRQQSDRNVKSYLL